MPERMDSSSNSDLSRYRSLVDEIRDLVVGQLRRPLTDDRTVLQQIYSRIGAYAGYDD